MEIRNGIDSSVMDDTDSSIKKNSNDAEVEVRPPSPCESEISVGCENESGEQGTASPMDMTDEDEGETGCISPSSTPSARESKGVTSPRTLSPSDRDGSESLAYLSEEEYFRPLKRLAMSDTSPHPLSSTQENLPSPEPLNHPTNTKQQQQQPQGQSEDPTTNKDSLTKNPQEVANKTDPPENGERRETEENNREERGVRVADRADAAEPKISGLRSFSILDILSYKPSRRKSSIPVKIVRPWDTREEPNSETRTTNRQSSNSSKNNNNANNNNSKKQSNDKGSALDALFKMTNKTLDNLNKEDKADAVNLFNNRAPAKKKRKSRTAFTNHQIFELEKRFLYQKYLSPADRDELAQSLGLSNAQVITWFQNRRAKLKRDVEELKRDVESSKVIHNKSLLEAASANVVAFLKAKDLPKIHLTALPR